LDRIHRDSADAIRAAVDRGAHDPISFRAALVDVPPNLRDEWFDRVLALGELPDDDPKLLPAGCVPYLPCSVDALLRVVDGASVRATDVCVDIGAGLGRAGAFLHLATGASVIGVEIQPELVRASRDVVARLPRVSCIGGDAADLAVHMTMGSIFFLYCPFSGERLSKVLAGLEAIARTKTIRVCCVDLPLPPCPWLVAERREPDLAVYRSTLAT
jgi:hypothetical protein